MLVGVVVTVVVAAITATVESVELVSPPHDARPAMRSAARSLFHASCLHDYGAPDVNQTLGVRIRGGVKFLCGISPC